MNSLKTPKPLLAARMAFPLAASLITVLLGEWIARGALTADTVTSFIFPHAEAYLLAWLFQFLLSLLLDCIIQLSTDMFMNTGISTYIWVLSKDKPTHRAGKVQLIDASHCFEPRRKSIGTKRNDITDVCRELIVTAYGEFANGKVYGDKNGIYCESKVFESVEFGYNKIVVERPQRDEAGNIILKRGKPVPDTSLRDTENVPLVQDIDAYFAREVLPYAPDAWIDHSKTKVGYEIPMTRYFYEYQAPEAVEDIVARITALEQDISAGLAELFHKEG